MRKYICIFCALAVILVGCGKANLTSIEDNADSMLESIPHATTIRAQLDALVLGGDIGYEFKDIYTITPRDLFAYIMYRSAEFFKNNAPQYTLTEEQCKQIILSDFGVEEIPFQYKNSPEYTINIRSEDGSDSKSTYVIKEVLAEENKISIVVELRATVPTGQLDFKCFLTQKIKYSFDVADEKVIITSAERL